MEIINESAACGTDGCIDGCFPTCSFPIDSFTLGATGGIIVVAIIGAEMLQS